MDSTNQLVILFYAMLFLGAGVSGGTFLTYSMFYQINIRAFHTQIKKLVLAGNVERAIKLCNAVPKPTASAATGAMLKASRELQSDPNLARDRAESDVAHGYRVGDTFHKRQFLMDAFDGAQRTGLKRLNVELLLIVGGFIDTVAALGLYVFVANGIPPLWSLAVVGVVFILAVNVVKQRLVMPGQLQTIRDDLLSILVAEDNGTTENVVEVSNFGDPSGADGSSGGDKSGWNWDG